MKNIFIKLFAALDTHSKGGYSARKLSAFVGVICIVWCHASWLRHSFVKGDYNLLPEILFLDYGFISLCLGLTTFETITKLKKENEPKSQQ